jgi:hypothetical protein
VSGMSQAVTSAGTTVTNGVTKTVRHHAWVGQQILAREGLTLNMRWCRVEATFSSNSPDPDVFRSHCTPG